MPGKIEIFDHKYSDSFITYSNTIGHFFPPVENRFEIIEIFMKAFVSNLYFKILKFFTVLEIETNIKKTCKVFYEMRSICLEKRYKYMEEIFKISSIRNIFFIYNIKEIKEEKIISKKLYMFESLDIGKILTKLINYSGSSIELKEKNKFYSNEKKLKQYADFIIVFFYVRFLNNNFNKRKDIKEYFATALDIFIDYLDEIDNEKGEALKEGESLKESFYNDEFGKEIIKFKESISDTNDELSIVTIFQKILKTYGIKLGRTFVVKLFSCFMKDNVSSKERILCFEKNFLSKIANAENFNKLLDFFYKKSSFEINRAMLQIFFD